VLLAFGDASWANASENCSQAGFILFLAEDSVLTAAGGWMSPHDWRSHRIRRVCRSTLAAECMAMDAAVDAAMFLRALLAEMLVSNYVAGKCGPISPNFLPLKSITDCRSLYDLLTKEGTPSTTLERRLSIDVAGLMQTGEEFDNEDPKKTFLWCPTQCQLADYLTKRMSFEKFRQVLQHGRISLVDVGT
jgi:hypothetical protein